MNFDTTKAMNYSWMSQASYLDLTSVVPGSADSLVSYLKRISINDGNIFSDQQAKGFTDPTAGYSFINQLANTVNGTSATVFKSNTDGSYTIAVRGTEPTAQLLTDLLQDVVGVVAAGKAKVQLIEAFRYYKQLTTTAGQAVTYSETEVNMLSAVLLSGTPLTGGLESLAAAKSAFAAITADDKGLGLIPTGATINFAGHSLGGHVAYLLADLVNMTSGGAYPLGDVMTYNAPGENALLYELQNWLGIGTSSQMGFIGGKHLAFYGEGGLNVTAGLGQVIGTRVPLFIENSGMIAGNIAMENHSIVKLSDSLAVYGLLQKLDPSLTPSTIDTLLKASTATDADSLEQTLDIVRKTMLGTGVSPTKAMGSADTQATREAFYANLYNLQGNDVFKTLAGAAQIESLSTSSADTLAAKAGQSDAEGLAYRYALKELNPFALLGADYGLHNQNGELDLYNKETGEGSLTEQYLADRAQFLVGVIEANTDDTGSGKALRVDTFSTDLAYFEDKTSGLSLQESNPLGVGTTSTRYLFGGTDNDTLFGTGETDHLYGGAGMDRLDGGQGDDYLEGNAGSDAFTGGQGDDTLIGGKGLDTYIFKSGDGWDWIEDQDGQGALYYDDIQLTGGDAVGDSGVVWQKTENGKTFTYILTDWTENGETFKRLSIEGPDGCMFVKRWQPGQLGITLPGTQAETPAPAVLVGTDKLHAEHNEAVITGNGGADLLEAGSVSTALYADDVIPNLTQYVADTAQLAGGGYLEAGALQGGSVLIGCDNGDDTVVGGTDNDALFGGAGRDQLIGGGGADFILGDGIYHPLLTPGDGAYTGWQLAAPSGDFAIAGSGFTEAIYSAGHPANDDADIIHGGGNDMAWGGFGDDLIYGQLIDWSGKDYLDGGEGCEMLRSTGKNGQKRNASGAANDDFWVMAA